MQMLCDLTDLALTINPLLPEKKRAQSATGRILVISAARLLELPDKDDAEPS
jgi:hypothetical protein